MRPTTLYTMPCSILAHIHTFLAICRENSISGAARRLNISQPSVSVTIAQLERALDTTLFERSRRGIALTEAGLALRERAEAMETLLEQAQTEVISAREGISGPLRIGGTPGALVSLLPDAIQRMEAGGRRFSLHVVERPDHELVSMLRKGEIAIALVTTGIEPPPADMIERTLAREPFDLLAGRINDHLPAELSLRETTALRWVLPEAQGAFRRQIDALFIAAETPTPREVIRCDSLLTTKAIIRNSARVTILPRRVASSELSIGVIRAIRITDASIQRSVGVRYLAGHRLSALAEALLIALDP